MIEYSRYDIMNCIHLWNKMKWTHVYDDKWISNVDEHEQMNTYDMVNEILHGLLWVLDGK